MGGNLGLWVPRRRGRRCYARQEFLDVSPGVDRDWATPSQNRAWDAVSLRLGWKNGEINSPLQTPTVQIAGCAIVAEWGKSWSVGAPASWETMLREARIPRCESRRRPRLGDAFTKSGMGCGEFTPRLEEWRDKLASTNPDGPNCRLRDCCGMGGNLGLRVPRRRGRRCYARH